MIVYLTAFPSFSRLLPLGFRSTRIMYSERIKFRGLATIVLAIRVGLYFVDVISKSRWVKATSTDVGLMEH